MYNVFNLYERACTIESYLDKYLGKHMKFGLTRTIINLEELKKSDFEKGIGLEIDTDINYSLLDQEALVNTDSIYSYKFSYKSSDTSYAAQRHYRCLCGEIESDVAGIKCDKCLTYTTDRYATRGWITIKNFRVFNPYWLYLFIKNTKLKGVSNSAFEASIFQKVGATKNGSIYNILDLQDRDKLREWIQLYCNPETVQYFIDTIDSAMTNSIPVINRDFRHFQMAKSLSGPTIKTHPVNRLYILIASHTNKLNSFKGNESATMLLTYLDKINNSYKVIHTTLIEQLSDDKKADIRERLGGRRCSNAGRIILEGTQQPQIDACTLSYEFFGEFTLEYHLDTYIRLGLTPEAEHRLRCNIPNKDDFLLMTRVLEELRKENLNTIIVSRPPGIFRQSTVSLRIVGLTRDSVIRLNEICIAECLHGDKD